MKRYTETVVDWMIRQNVINEKEKELYGYALYSVGLLILPLLFAVGIGFILGSIKSGIALVVPFMILRKYSGGYHAKKFSHCAVDSVLLLFLCIKFSMQIKCDWKLLFVTVIASVSLIKFSPMDHESRRLDEAEKYRYKKIVIGLVCTLDMLCIILFIQGYHNLIISMCVGIQMTAGVQLPIIIKSMTHNDQKRALNVVWCKKN